MKNNKGYSLVELLMAIATFSIVMVVIFAIMNNASKYAGNGTKDLPAFNIRSRFRGIKE